jgi:hypothetical protein
MCLWLPKDSFFRLLKYAATFRKAGEALEVHYPSVTKPVIGHCTRR